MDASHAPDPTPTSRRSRRVRLGGVIVALTHEPQTTRAWASGATGEEALGKALGEVPGVAVLHDRRMPGSRANIDHIAIGPAGVFVVDAKHYHGRIAIHNRGGLFRTDLRLYVGRRDCSGLADKVEWQAESVRAALRSGNLGIAAPVVPVLCFIDGDWPRLKPPSSYRSVRLESQDSIQRLVSEQTGLDPGSIDRITRLLATALPSR